MLRWGAEHGVFFPPLRISSLQSRTQVSRSGAGLLPSLRYPVAYLGAMVAAALAGAVVASTNATTALRGVIGLPVILSWLRYPYFLLLSWALIDPFIGSTAPFFNGSNLDSALTFPTLILVFTLPITRTFKRIPALPLFLAFVVWVLLGLNVSPLDHTEFLKQWLLLVDYVAVAVLAVKVVSTPRRMSGLITCLLVPAVAIGLYGIYGYATHQNILTTGNGPARITSIFSDAPTLALLLSNAVPLALYRVLTTRGPWRLLALSAVAVLVVGTGLTFSRGAIISVVICVVIMIMLVPSARLRIGLLGIAAAVVFVAAFANVGLLERFGELDTGTLNGRT
jgi:hypothetical protein